MNPSSTSLNILVLASHRFSTLRHCIPSTIDEASDSFPHYVEGGVEERIAHLSK